MIIVIPTNELYPNDFHDIKEALEVQDSFDVFLVVFT